ncbi:MAG TPA: hypothetical protein DDW84_00245 [Phycisphaerales bacterium]|nr:MAG: hypothetical protein A2Y13_01910 [Planctomycetes bacterium GWC2_45_44]HBG77267.1 hypothetical protein [Phycisphaerales bacterium]HBR19176.1 hypothetical protein [Phycisphaerales bacterium]
MSKLRKFLSLVIYIKKAKYSLGLWNIWIFCKPFHFSRYAKGHYKWRIGYERTAGVMKTIQIGAYFIFWDDWSN